MTEVKRCVYCGAEFARKPRNSRAEWEARKVCSRSCRPSLEERLWANVDRRGADECWPWLAGVTSSDHAQIRLGRGVDDPRRSRPVHVIAYELLVGQIPSDLHVHHECENPVCCNPAHMRLVTRAEHARLHDGAAFFREKTHCPKGHPYSPENTYRAPIGGGRGCRLCRTEACRRHRARKRASAAVARTLTA